MTDSDRLVGMVWWRVERWADEWSRLTQTDCSLGCEHTYIVEIFQDSPVHWSEPPLRERAREREARGGRRPECIVIGLKQQAPKALLREHAQYRRLNKQAAIRHAPK